MEKDNFGITDKISLETNKGIKSGFGFDVNVKAELFDQFGNLKEKREVHNTGTDASLRKILGEDLLALVPAFQRRQGDPLAPFVWKVFEHSLGFYPLPRILATLFLRWFIAGLGTTHATAGGATLRK